MDVEKSGLKEFRCCQMIILSRNRPGDTDKFPRFHNTLFLGAKRVGAVVACLGWNKWSVAAVIMLLLTSFVHLAYNVTET